MMEMNNFEDFDARVDRFLRHNMTREEELAFKLEIAKDSEKKERARLTALMIKTMRQEGLERDYKIIEYVKNINEEEFRNKLKLKSRVINFLPRIIKYSIAACITGFVLFGVYCYYEYNQTVSLGNSQYFAYVSDVSEMGSFRGIEYETIRQSMVDLFANVEDGVEINSTIKELEYLYDNCHFDNSPYSEFIDDISWNLAIAYLKKGKRKKSIPILEEMLKRNINYPEISQPVQDLIAKIKML